ncbi:hypothetical protein A9Q83_16740 [Alphaproteobacteria bacterium 46_93_T64]|nr:hypothetical protein A9Q83_16740 [Alphaproteobacteria bacterium 46_93_T64]
MSGIRSTSGSTPTSPVETGKGTPVSQQVTPVGASSPTGGQNNPSVPQSTNASSLTEGAIFSAVVTARATGGDTMLHTEVGNFRMASGNPIPVGSHVVLEVESASEVIIARVVAINGEKLASPPSVTLLPIVNTLPQAPENYGLSGNILQQDNSEGGLKNITTALGNAVGKLAVDVGAKPQGQVSQQNTQNTQQEHSPKMAKQTTPIANSSFLASTLSANNSTSTSTQGRHSGTAAYAHTTNPGQKVSSIGIGIPATSNVQPTTASAQITTGNQGRILEIVRATIDHAPLSQQITLPSGEQQVKRGSKLPLIVSNAATGTQNITSTGIVISHSGVATNIPAGQQKQIQVHVQTASLGTLRYTTTNPPAIGSQVSLTLAEKMDQFPILTTPTTSSYFKTPHLPIMTEWHNLSAMLNAIAADNPELAASVLNSRIPSPSNQLGASLLFFLSALNGGNVNKWLGQGVQASLEKLGKGDLFRSLSDDFANLTRINSETGGQDWKTLVFPFYNGETLRQLRMFYRQHDHQGGEKDEDETRFIIELDLSKTGPVQLDGLFKKHQFDLVFRSQRMIDESLRVKVSEIFKENIEITGLKGSLTFRQTTPFPLHPTEEWEGMKPDFLNA